MTRSATQKRMGRPPAAESADTRERVLSAAIKCFGLQGYDKTTNKDIADEADLTTGALYHYFESKQDLFVAALLHEQTLVLDEFEDAASQVPGAVDKLCAVLARARDLNARNDALARFASIAPIELQRHPEFGAAVNGQTGGIAGLFTEILVEAKARGELYPDVDLEGVLMMLLATTQGMAMLASLTPDPAMYSRAIDALQDLLASRVFKPVAQGKRRKRGRPLRPRERTS